MRNNPLAISSSASNYLDAIHSRYNKRRYGVYLTTASTFLTYVSGACGVYHDHENNLYVVTYTRVSTSGTNATTSNTYGILIEKFDKSGRGSFSDTYRTWAKGFYKSGLRLTPKYVKVSNTGHIAIVGDESYNNDAFVLIVNPSGTAEVFDTWRTASSTFKISFTSCHWNDSYSGGTAKLQVIGEQNAWGYTGSSPFYDQILIRYGINENYASACYNIDMDSQSGYTVLQGYSQTFRAAGTVAYYEGPNENPYYTSDNNGWYNNFAMYGNGTDYLHKLLVTRSRDYGAQYLSSWSFARVRKIIDFANVTSYGSSSFKVKNGSYIGQVTYHDSKLVEYGYNNTTSYVILCAIKTRNSSGASNYGQYGLLSLSYQGTVNWFKKIPHYNDSTYLYNDEYSSNSYSSRKSRGFAVLDNRATGSSMKSHAYGYAVPTLSDPDTITILHIDANGVLQGAVDINEANSAAGNIKFVTCKNDMYGNVFVHYWSDDADSRGYRIIKLPNPAFKRWTGTTTWTEGTSVTEATLTVNNTIALYDGISELSQSSSGTHYYSNLSSGTFLRSQYIGSTFNNLDVFNHAGTVNDRSDTCAPSPSI